MRRAAKRDANEAEIVTALLAVGCSVTRLSGEGLPDLLVGAQGRTLLMEVKMPLGAKGGTSHRELTDDQELWWKRWRGLPVALVRSAQEALAAIKTKRHFGDPPSAEALARLMCESATSDRYDWLPFEDQQRLTSLASAALDILAGWIKKPNEWETP